MSSDQTPASAIAPTCYRHPKRETWVSCGRCGKPLCPDCMRHGPVGIRCEECLHPAGAGADDTLHPPQNIPQAYAAASALALAWVALMAWLGVRTGVPAPGMLPALLAGCSIGWTVWRLTGRTWNRATRRTAVLLGALAPLAAYLALLLISRAPTALLLYDWPINLVRALVATGIAALFAALLATQRRGTPLL